MSWPGLKMIIAVAVWIATAAALPANFGPLAELAGSCPADDSSAARRLAQGLSRCAEVYYPGSSEFNVTLLRWSAYKSPKANVVVLPCTEADVSVTVKYANEKKMPFLAVDTGHGTISSLGNMKWGVQISLEKLSSVHISKDGKTATVGGGTKSTNVTQELWAAGKQTVTGTAECVSYLGPGLGGGHGFLQGHYGLISDQYISLNVVLADGTLKTVDEKDDLFWAMKGAGHNFGIVTSVTSKIYTPQAKEWAIATLTFKGSKVEDVYQAANTRFIDGNQTEDVVSWSMWANNRTLDAKNPVIIYMIMQEGVKAVEETWLKPFLDVGPISIQKKAGVYTDLSDFIGSGINMPPCQKDGQNGIRFSVYLERFNTTAMREAYEVFAGIMQDGSPYSITSRCMFEGYPTQGVRAAGLNSSAFPFRDSNILSLASIGYFPDGAGRDEKAIEAGEKFRKILQSGSGYETRRVYINYGFGNESPKEWYGSEEWRQKRLRALKQKYDPKGQYDFYGPIP